MSEVKKVLTAVDRSTKALAKQATELSKVANTLVGLTDITQSLADEVEIKEGQLAEIGVTISEKERVAKAELNVRLVENEDRVLAGLLTQRGLAEISKEELQSLTSELSDAQEDNQVAIEDAVKQAEKNAAIASNAVKSSLEAKHSVDTAELKATNSALQNKVEFLEATVTDLKAMIESERNARVEMSSNASQPTINVNSAK